MSRTMPSSAQTRRRSPRNIPPGINKSPPPREAHDISEECSDEEMRGSSLDEDEVDDDTVEVSTESVPHQKKHLYPSLSSLQFEQDYVSAARRTLNSTETENVPSPFECGFPAKVLCVVCVLVLVFAITIPKYFYADSTPVVIESSEAKDNVREIIHKLKEKFDSQSDLSYRIIKAALDKVMASRNEMQPSAPAILLLISTRGAKNVTIIFAEQLAKLVAAGDTNYQTIDGEQLQHEDPDTAKKKIDDLIIDTVVKKEQKVILIKHLDVIPSNAVMMLHNYCDHENARYKNAVFIMTIDADADISSRSDSRQFDEAAESHLSIVWRDLPKDSLRSLLSRITVSVAAIYRTHHSL